MKIFIGYDSREGRAYDVCKFSIEKRASDLVEIQPLKLEALQRSGQYWRTYDAHNGVKYDHVDKKPFSTEFTFSRFLVPHLCGYKGWALFMDSDMLMQADVHDLFRLADERYAVQVVKHEQVITETGKMDGQIQEAYPRKNWSSFMLFNCAKCTELTVSHVNTMPGAYLHQFRWLTDDQIGELPEEWNWLEGHSSPDIAPKNIHYTRGGPWFDDFPEVMYGDLWMHEENEMRGHIEI
jgi:lipopolysaccharide biosynthesis glycosyltransferase